MYQCYLFNRLWVKSTTSTRSLLTIFVLGSLVFASCSSGQVSGTASVETGWDGDRLIVRSLGYGGPAYSYTRTTAQRRTACEKSARQNAIDIAYHKKLLTLPKATTLRAFKAQKAGKGKVEAIDFDADNNCRAKVVFLRADLGA